jgi:ribosomal protein S2
MAPSNFPDVLKPTQQDIEYMLSAGCHLGSKNKNTHLESYIYRTRADGINVLNVGKTCEYNSSSCERGEAGAAARQDREIEKIRFGQKTEG